MDSIEQLRELLAYQCEYLGTLVRFGAPAWKVERELWCMLMLDQAVGHAENHERW